MKALCVVVAIGLLVACAAARAADLAPGDAAPAFSLPGPTGRPTGSPTTREAGVVVAWFPKAFTGG